ncbi:MAG: UDP-N-acetylmuramoyl-L-alanyl-D-glutamate--2,6-diaminopimelate ligase [Ruminococcaceae bacterium]|nr:UDP-N-acetylmuramoyl-L-alanyl-D-glutamate--2,6-diaminopimelate ligase [Oscillospiraceae bacterium]
MKKTVRDIFSAVPDGILLGTIPIQSPALSEPVSMLRCDSRLATARTVFFCLVGKTVDGHEYAPSAYRNGCRIFVVEHPLELPEDALQFQVPDSRIALADCAAEFYGHPEREIRLIGLTGTKGKTTTALLIRSLLEDAGIPTGYIGTNGIDYKDFHHQTVNSTPESVEIYRYLRYMLDEGVRACVLEVSSQALWMGRTRGLRFDTVLFTNLSRDHIGGVEHPDFEHYRDCKKLLFTDYPACTAVVNRNDGHAAYMTEGIQTPVLDFGLCDSTDTDKPLWAAACIRPMNRDGRIGVGFEAFRGGISLGDSWFLPLPGQFNVQNALSALTVVCEGFGVDPLRAKRALEQAVAAGRFESIISPALPDVTFVIDYAHNGISLASILDALKEYRPTRLICLFGSVGGRTRERRRDLAEAAGHRCDLCILTSDNPACEPPMEIIDEIDAAFPEGSCPRIKISDRAEAIRYAVEIAEAGDIILLAGKGHEDYQLVGTKRIPFSEGEILREALEGIPAF